VVCLSAILIAIANNMLNNPPFGATWGGKDGYQDQAEKLRTTRSSAGILLVQFSF
jgi:hypothetical protein